MKTEDISWGFYSKAIIVVFLILQLARWILFPQFLDMYYHLLTAWGFMQAEGYSSWDFWSCAPLGRPHLYPPLFSLLLVFFLKLGISKVFLAKFFECSSPIIFLWVLRWFTRRHYGERFSFFVLLIATASFSFYLSLINNIPATFACVLGLCALDQVLKKNLVRAVILLGLSFYTHASVSWFFALGILLYAFCNRSQRRIGILAVFFAVLFSAPLLFQQLLNTHFFSLKGIEERMELEFKCIEYLSAVMGLCLLRRKPKEYMLFLSLLLASLVFLPYPYRFFDALGYLPVIFLAALTFEYFYERFHQGVKGTSYALVGIMVGICIFSPTILMLGRGKTADKIKWGGYLFDCSLVDMVLPGLHNRLASTSVWYSSEYLSAAKIVVAHSQENDIVYSNLNIMGYMISALAGRPTANLLLTEVQPLAKFDPFVTSRIIILSRDSSFGVDNYFTKAHHPKNIGENKLLIVYMNDACVTHNQKRQASLPFWAIGIIGAIITLVFVFAGIPRKPKEYMHA